MKSLRPYPTPNKNQEKLVHRVELAANVLKSVLRAARVSASPITFFPSHIKRKITKKRWNMRAANVPDDELISPTDNAVFVPDQTSAMDQNFFYQLKHGRIWFKPIGAPLHSEWKLFGPDGLTPTGLPLKRISSDGYRMIAVDINNTVNKVDTDAIHFYTTDQHWEMTDIKLNWHDRWFAFPVINQVVGLFRGKHLKLPNECIAVAISQKGPETGYYTDLSGKSQPEFLVGVTTLYALFKNGRILFADPWLGNGFCNEITAPEDGRFVAENMAVAASTIFLIRRDERGRPCMYTRLADFDTIGADPILPASYNPDNKIPLVRRIPGEDWVKQPDIPLHKHAKVTGNIAVLQTGRGQHNRQLRVEGINAKGEVGYYFKNIYENKWHFELTPGKHLKFKTMPQVVSKKTNPRIFAGEILIANNKISRNCITHVSLNNFLKVGLNERGLHTVVDVTLDNGKLLSLPLHARRGWVHLFGLKNNHPNWYLVMPKAYRNINDNEVQTALKLLFNNKMSTRVSLHELKNGDIKIKNERRGFKIIFHPKLSSIDSKANKHMQLFKPIAQAFVEREEKVSKTTRRFSY